MLYVIELTTYSVRLPVVFMVRRSQSLVLLRFFLSLGISRKEKHGCTNLILSKTCSTAALSDISTLRMVGGFARVNPVPTASHPALWKA